MYSANKHTRSPVLPEGEKEPWHNCHLDSQAASAGVTEEPAVSRAAGEIRGVSGKWLSEYLVGNSNKAYLFPLTTDVYLLFSIMMIKKS